MITIKNKQQLIENGKTALVKEARALALSSIEHALNASEPKHLLYSKLTLQGSLLHAGKCTYDLNRFRHVYVVGGGKAGVAMAAALEGIISKWITSGIVNVPHGSKHETNVIELNEASHPIPDETGVEGAQRMLALAEKAEKDDLIICLLSGGGSSLIPLPRDGITLYDKRAATGALLKSGASIQEINVVRKHLSGLKGGWLAKKAYPAAVLNVVLSDVVGDALDTLASGPTTPDPSTFLEARRILEKYNLWNSVSESVHKLISDGLLGFAEETPKAGDKIFGNVCTVIVGNNKTATHAAFEYLKSKGLSALVLDEPLIGEARKAGERLAIFARRITASREPLSKPAGVVAGGETTVTVVGGGEGGRNQELALAAAQQLEGAGSTVLVSVGTDGVDGSTNAAGAIVDGFSISRSKELGLVAEHFLAENDSYSFFSSLNDLVLTGLTGTNVNDISVIVRM